MQQHLFTQLIPSAEEDANELDRLRRLLCLPRKEVDKVNKEICGRIYQDVSLLDSSQHNLNNAFQTDVAWTEVTQLFPRETAFMQIHNANHHQAADSSGPSISVFEHLIV